MRLWHQALIHHLDNKRLLGQHRECCALRGKGWGRKHSVVNYVFEHPYEWLFAYHCLVMREMNFRGYKIDNNWNLVNYHGKQRGIDINGMTIDVDDIASRQIYSEHDDKYLMECLQNLKSKGTELINGKTLDEEILKLAIKGVR